MRIAPTTPGKTVARTSKSRAAGKTGGAFSVTGGSAADTPAAGGGVSGAGPIVPVSALLALQEAPDAATAPSRGVGRANELLRLLDQVRLGLLAGGIPRHVLARLARDLAAERSATADPRLVAVLDEIDLRARVELAKYEPPTDA